MSWSIENWVFGFGRWTKHSIDFSSLQSVYCLKKYDELSKSVAFAQKLRYFTDQNRPRK